MDLGNAFMRLMLCASLLLAAGFVGGEASAASPFACRLRETQAYLPELSTAGGYRWIECRVLGAQTVEIEGVSINDGKCASFDYWYAGRRFEPGQAVNIPYACMTPISLIIAFNGGLTKISLRQGER